jgi:hypothetical protein
VEEADLFEVVVEAIVIVCFGFSSVQLERIDWNVFELSSRGLRQIGLFDRDVG